MSIANLTTKIGTVFFLHELSNQLNRCNYLCLITLEDLMKQNDQLFGHNLKSVSANDMWNIPLLHTIPALCD